MDLHGLIRRYLCVTFVFITAVNQGLCLSCYHDKYAPDPQRQVTAQNGQADAVEAQNKGDNFDANRGDNLVKQCGRMEKCLSCMTINTEIKRYEHGQGLTAYKIKSRVCVKEKSVVKEKESGCERIGQPNNRGNTEICHCFKDMCNI